MEVVTIPVDTVSILRSLCRIARCQSFVVDQVQQSIGRSLTGHVVPVRDCDDTCYLRRPHQVSAKVTSIDRNNGSAASDNTQKNGENKNTQSKHRITPLTQGTLFSVSARPSSRKHKKVAHPVIKGWLARSDTNVLAFYARANHAKVGRCKNEFGFTSWNSYGWASTSFTRAHTPYHETPAPSVETLSASIPEVRAV